MFHRSDHGISIVPLARVLRPLGSGCQSSQEERVHLQMRDQVHQDDLVLVCDVEYRPCRYRFQGLFNRPGCIVGYCFANATPDRQGRGKGLLQDETPPRDGRDAGTSTHTGRLLSLPIGYSRV